ncbi:4Fe-4S dicluster-binding protein [uncultured Clostridium sp.]|uniref:DUF362 domain-containing protein n=1 Tax=uncultured Clostridium sp. TaxID=59620 RepID=UPI0028ECBE9E|nr:4Fe-4S dicluster-binding protein [uncultured Clostridium sp.]
MNKTLMRKKAYVDTKFCVACGICARNFPIKAISINKRMYANVDLDKCVGCTKCSIVCPASVIEIK